MDAAALLFARDGYAVTPMRAIAAEAGVSVQSVHLAGPKSSLLLAAFERTFAGDEGRHALSERPALAKILAGTDPAVMLTEYVAFLAAANERAAGIWRALNAAADADELVRGAAEDLEARRRAELKGGVQLMISLGLLKAEGADVAADVLGFLTAPHTYLYFVEDSGWSRERYEDWLRTALVRLVFDTPV